MAVTVAGGSHDISGGNLCLDALIGIFFGVTRVSVDFNCKPFMLSASKTFLQLLISSSIVSFHE